MDDNKNNINVSVFNGRKNVVVGGGSGVKTTDSLVKMRK